MTVKGNLIKCDAEDCVAQCATSIPRSGFARDDATQREASLDGWKSDGALDYCPNHSE